ncbi:hydrolase [Flavipsychrobacter stenotrophus]|uniref:Hydrolase n=1 Tax=Flavipsychrobacter stenotrophus TaxID=2077091 RepID=A0A2S7SVX5_9BACT|nr:hydrolase [Flavipsychrobacter stenotrophus]
MNGKDTQCACCGYYTLGEGSIYDICPVCFWEDCAVQNEDPDDSGGPNHVSLKEAKANYKQYEVVELQFKEHVRKPTEEEMKPR